MKSVERESLLKSFFLFFISQALLVGALFFISYQKELQSLDAEIFSQMRICSFDLRCKALEIDFIPKKDQEIFKLYKTPKELAAYFTIPGSQKNYLKIYLRGSDYQKRVAALQKNLLEVFLFVLVVIALLSIVFSLYTLSPLRNALRLTEEFIKDILHDFNTPLATLRLNVAMLARELGENTKIKRIENAVESILSLQENLRSYLHSHALQAQKIELAQLLEERTELLGSNYSDITIEIDPMDVTLFVNRDAFVRILDNLISNALKYNKEGGFVHIWFERGSLHIEDSGKGIENPKRIFERFYKEQERGIGIGLHIVKKLCDALEIPITLKSSLGKGTKFSLNLSNIISH